MFALTRVARRAVAVAATPSSLTVFARRTLRISVPRFNEAAAAASADTNTNPDIRCASCNQKGHVARFCPTRQCFVCGETGHIANECKKENAMNMCFNCGEVGHRGNACPKPRVCLNCGKEGHSMRKCPEPKADKLHRTSA